MDDLENRFTYHAPKDGQPVKYETIREYGKALAVIINKYCPNSREKSLAVTKIEEAVMWANASIARHPAEQNDNKFQRQCTDDS